MAGERDRLRANLAGMARGEAGFLAVSRVQVDGEVSGWREDIAWERGGQQSCLRQRSQADAGGARIGRWQGPAEEARATALVQALAQVQFWALPGDTELEPGTGIVNWTCATQDAVVDVVVKSGSPLLRRMAPLDQELREMANALEAANRGASLRLALQWQASAQGQGAYQGTLRLGLVNEGQQRGVLVGPAAFGPPDPEQVNGLRLEIAAMPEAAAGVTAPDAVFRPLRQDILKAQRGAVPLDDEYIVLHPRQPLVLPQALSLDPAVEPLAPGSRHILRAVYAYHGGLDQVAGLPVLRGRAFSNEVVVQV